LRAHLASILLVSLALSGCADGEPKTGPPALAPSAPEVGRLEGVVYDGEFSPLRGVRVTLTDHATVALTDGRGAFFINDIPPGDYVVEAGLTGYRGASQRISVGAGEILSLRLELEVIPIVVAYPELIQYTGHMTVGVATALYAFRPGTEVEDQLEFSRDLADDARAWVAAMAFLRTSPAGAEKFQLDSILDGILYNQTYGESPLLNRVDQLPAGGRLAQHSIWLPRTCDYYILATCYADPPSSMLQFALDQRFEIYSTIFYGGPAPTDYTGLPS
jgi:hypothetical protein